MVLELQSSRSVKDRLSSLPDELLIRILSLLPTKDVAATCVLSKRLMRVFPWINSLDFDVSPIVSLCQEHPHKVERYPCFVTFVNTVLEAHQSQHLTGFRLRVGSVDFGSRYFYGCTSLQCKEACLPDLKPSQINAWIHFPLTRFGLRELDLCIWVREHGDSQIQLPTQIFTSCETLEVLKLDTNLGLDQIFAMPSYCLPNLKLFHLCASLVSDDDFVTRLVSNCPVLEDLSVEAWRDHVHHTSIYSPSLRKLRIRFQVLGYGEFDSCDSVLIHTPNLEYFEYLDNLAYQYSIPEMHSLVKASINMNYEFQHEDIQVSYHQLLGFIRPFVMFVI